MIQQFTIPPGGRIVNAAGTFFRYEQAGPDAVDEALRLRVNGNDMGTYLPGDSIELPILANTWELAQASGSGHVVRIGNGRVITSRTVMTGSVAVTDSGEADSLNRAAFFGFAHAPQSGTQFGSVGLYNGSATRNIYVKRLAIGARNPNIGWKLARLVGAPAGAQVPNATSGGKFEGATQEGLMYAAANQATGYFSAVGFVDFPMLAADWADTQKSSDGWEILKRGDEPIIVEPGQSIVLHHTVAASASTGYGCHMLAHWVER